jgi:hypothetical protein
MRSHKRDVGFNAVLNVKSSAVQLHAVDEGLKHVQNKGGIPSLLLCFVKHLANVHMKLVPKGDTRPGYCHFEHCGPLHVEVSVNHTG